MSQRGAFEPVVPAAAVGGLAPGAQASLGGARSDPLTRGVVLLVCLLVFLEVQPYRLPTGARGTYPVFIFAALLLFIWFRRRLLANLREALRWPLVVFSTYLVWIVISSFWSYYPFTSASQSVPLIAAFLVAVCFCDYSPRATAKAVVIVGVAVSLLSWVMFLIYPPSAVIPDVVWRLSGPLMHSQRLGLLVGLSLICLVSLVLNREPSTIRLPRYVLVLAFALLAGTLWATNTRAFTAFALITCVLLIFLWMRMGTQILLAVIGVLVVAFVLLSWQELYGLVDRGGRDVTLTGRLPLWEFTADMISRRPLLGYGFATFGSDLTRPATHIWVAPHAHNGWLNAAFETGLIGAALLTLFLIACLVLAIRRPDLAVGRPEAEEGPKSRRAGFSYLLGPTVFIILCATMGLLVGGRLTTPYAILLMLAAQTAREARLSSRRDEEAVGR